MNAAISPIDFEEFSSPVRLSSPLKPIPQFVEDDGDIDDMLFFQSLESLDPSSPHTQLPTGRHTVLDTDSMVLPASLIRRIEHELRDNQHDSRTVLSACRGLPRGSRQFEEAYIAARIRSFAKKRRPASPSLMGKPPEVEVEPEDFYQPTMQKTLPPRSHPMAVIRLGDLMSHFGIWVMGLLGIQLWAAWRIGTFANEFLQGGRDFHVAVALLFLLAVDSWVWFSRRGNLSSVFHVPGVVLFLMALLPVFALHLRDVILTMK